MRKGLPLMNPLPDNAALSADVEAWLADGKGSGSDE